MILLILISLLRGASGMTSIVGVTPCSPWDFTLLVLSIVFLVVITAINILLVKREYTVKIKNGYQLVDGDLSWTPKLITKFLFSAFGAGFVASVVGLGGGVIFNPLLLSFKVPPSVSSATGMYMIMFSTLSSSILYYLSGILNIGFAFW
mmetsp:Transcript_43583/g.51323  ORF Transcript_43583/g.51323 Transcript_43583/m.51323 type:complete len:149 (+) Transcript_43583:771-1217(+)